MGAITLTLQETIDSERYRFDSDYAVIGLDKYPIWDENYRAALNDKIIAHYNEVEIAHETVSMFRYAMARKMNEIMPLFNQHYLASQINIDPLKTIDIKTVASGTENSSTDTTTDSKGRVVASNTPQVRLAGNADYATSAQDSNTKTSADGTATNHSDNNSATSGYQGNAAELIFSMRQTFVNVDMMVIDSLEELFLMVWDTGAEHTNNGGYIDYYTNWFYPF